jgi:DNA polymerase III psi subunit
VKVENPVAFSFIMQDELYLLNKDKKIYIESSVNQPVPEDNLVNFHYMGGHKKKFLVVVHYPEIEFIENNHLTALENILKRLEFSIDDVAILNSATHTDIVFEALMDFFKPQKMLLLGKNALPGGIEPLTLNKPQQLSNCSILFSFSFDEMMDNNEHKKAFWEQMKQL